MEPKHRLGSFIYRVNVFRIETRLHYGMVATRVCVAHMETRGATDEDRVGIRNCHRVD
jgi:hypothetical protein